MELKMTKIIIGRKDIVDFPTLGLMNVPVKIDSGAFSSSIHCSSVEEVIVEGQKVLRVIFLDAEDAFFSEKTVTFEKYTKRLIKSSNGIAEDRFVVNLELNLFGEKYHSDFSLTKRNGLKFPVLLGRKLLNKNFLIDTSKSNLSYKFKIKNENSDIITKR